MDAKMQQLMQKQRDVVEKQIENLSEELKIREEEKDILLTQTKMLRLMIKVQEGTLTRLGGKVKKSKTEVE
jgi:hypothetical protein